MSGELILVIEDNAVNRKLTQGLLEHAGLRVVGASTAEEGVGLAHQLTPDLIVMDIGLPDEDGVTALRRLKADEETATIPVLAVTAYAMEGDRERLLSAGFDGYVPKPINIDEFMRQIERFVGRDAEGTSREAEPA